MVMVATVDDQVSSPIWPIMCTMSTHTSHWTLSTSLQSAISDLTGRGFSQFSASLDLSHLYTKF